MRVILLIVTMLAASDSRAEEWTKLSSLPDQEGFAGLFAGVCNGSLLVAGGANFPDRKPWDGGRKVWYDNVFVLNKPNGEWKVAGKLPRPLGYGVSVSYRGGVVCVGGSDAERHYADVFRLELSDGKLTTTTFPPLPKPVANACGALVGDILYVAGGQEKPDSNGTLKTAFRIDLSAQEPKWKEIEACPGGGRMLSVAAGFDAAFWMVGGVDLIVGNDEKVKRKYLRDAYRYDPDKGWKQIADPPHPIAAAPSPAPTVASGFVILGGDDGSQVKVVPDQHRGFGKKVLTYEPKTERWTEVGELSAPRVTAPCLLWNKLWVVPSGEMRPGVRSPEVWGFSPGTDE